MKTTLVTATAGRTEELHVLMDGLRRQTRGDFELIIVDQNPDDRLVPVVAAFGDLDLRHLRSPRGLSRARNVGIGHVRGDIVGFPDDDCVYPPDLLERVMARFAAEPALDGLIGVPVAPDGTPLNRPRSALREMRAADVWGRGISYCIFLRVARTAEYLHFDEELGVGSGTPWLSGEETDLLIRLIDAGRRIAYDPTLRVFHPRRVLTYDDAAFRRARDYGRGAGRVLRKRRVPLPTALRVCLSPLAKALPSLLIGRFGAARFLAHRTLGRLAGWLVPAPRAES